MATVQGLLDSQRYGGIQNLGVIDGFRGLGIGWAVLLKSLEGFAASGARRAFLEVTAKNELAVRMYRRLGFRSVKTIYREIEVEEQLDTAPTLVEIAAVAGLNPYHFARQFKAATGLPPHQYVITRRVERAKHILRAGTDLSLAEVAARAGFYDQSQFSNHFKRLVGATPSQFRKPSSIA